MPKRKRRHTATQASKQLEILERLRAELKEQAGRIPKGDDWHNDSAWEPAREGAARLDAVLDEVIASGYPIEPDRLYGERDLTGLRVEFLDPLNLEDWTGWTEAGIRRLKLAPTLNVKRSHRRPSLEVKRPTAKQAAALEALTNSDWNFAEAGRLLGLDPKTVRQHVAAAYRKVGASMPDMLARMRKTGRTQDVPHGSDGTVLLDANDPGKLLQRSRKPRGHNSTGDDSTDD